MIEDLTPERRAAQAVDALRHGWPLRFDGGREDDVVLLPVETAVASEARAEHMLISAARATTLKLANQKDAAVPHAPVLIRGGEDFTIRDAVPIADPALDLALLHSHGDDDPRHDHACRNGRSTSGVHGFRARSQANPWL